MCPLDASRQDAPDPLVSGQDASGSVASGPIASGPIASGPVTSGTSSQPSSPSSALPASSGDQNASPAPALPILLTFPSLMDYPNKLSHTYGCEIWKEDGKIRKSGFRVRLNEEAALRLVKEHTTIPVPEIYSSIYGHCGGDEWGHIWMEHMPGAPLDKLWDDLEDATKERLCKQIWGFVDQLRSIPKPPGLLYQCEADGSASRDPMLEPDASTMDDPCILEDPLVDDEAVRNRINIHYKRRCGDSYGENLMDFLPRSNISVFSHNDLSPRNILVDESLTITALLDWEYAGWYPDYWEYAMTQIQINSKCFKEWMDRTKPQDWDILGIRKARRVLY
ncbi:kinase-like domain-containing protein [Xylaria sp. CBS 124048]|nr:kinase-like domain-containing protein [Xylaria sp. CBS 124048]